MRYSRRSMRFTLFRDGLATGTLALGVLAASLCPLTASEIGPKVAETAAPRISRCEGFWIVSSREICDPDSNPAEAIAKLRYYRAGTDGDWQAVAASDLVGGIQDASPVVLWIHGNRMDLRDLVHSAAVLRHVLDKVAPAGGHALVAWAWPADRMVRGIRQDSRLKACRSVREAFLLAEWVKQQLAGRRVVLIGYSFGTQTALKTASLLEQGRGRESAWESSRASVGESEDGREGRKVLPTVLSVGTELGAADPMGEGLVAASWAVDEGGPPSGSAAPRVRLLLMAAACPVGALNWITAEESEPLVDWIGVTVNRRDPALRWYEHLWSRRGPPALGAVGPCAAACNLVDDLAIVNLSCQVGRTHDWEVYFRSPGFQSLVRQAVADLAEH